MQRLIITLIAVLFACLPAIASTTRISGSETVENSFLRKDTMIYALDYDVSNVLIYVGSAVTGSGQDEAKWFIQKLTYDGSGNLTDVQNANDIHNAYGSEPFKSIWDDRTGYTYE